jgi:hypothetical protein
MIEVKRTKPGKYKFTLSAAEAHYLGEYLQDFCFENRVTSVRNATNLTDNLFIATVHQLTIKVATKLLLIFGETTFTLTPPEALALLGCLVKVSETDGFMMELKSELFKKFS